MMRRGLSSFGRGRRRRQEQEGAVIDPTTGMETDAFSSGTDDAVIGSSALASASSATTGISKSAHKPANSPGPAASFSICNTSAVPATSKADRAIVSTASDAITSKLHAVSAGYYDDPFIDHFARGAEGLTAAASTGGTGGSATTPLPVHLEDQAACTEAVAAGAPSCSTTTKGISVMASSNQRRHHYYGHHQSNRNRQHDLLARSHSSPPDSSSSAASSFYEDTGDEDQHKFHLHEHATPLVNQGHHDHHHHQHHPRPHQFHQLRHAEHFHTSHSSRHGNPLAAMSPSDVHPALRNRLGIAGGGDGIGPPLPIHPGLQRHISTGPSGTVMAIPPRINNANAHIHRYGHGQGGQPLIRRGTHARVCAMDRALTAFLSADTGADKKGDRRHKNSDNNFACTKQIVVLGAGRDTSYFRYLDGKLIGSGSGSGSSNANGGEKANSSKNQPAEKEMVRWFEVDHAGVMHRKMELLKTCPGIIIDELQKDETGKVSYAASIQLRREGTSKKVNESDVDEDVMGVDLHDPNLLAPFSSSKSRQTNLPHHLVGFDLRLPPSHLFDILQSEHGFDPNVPTLFLLECVIMYMPESSATRLFQEISSTCGPNAIIAIYDPILGNDGFGRVMEQNLTRAGVVAAPTSGTNDPLCLTVHRTIDSRLDSLISCGFNIAIGCDMLAAYDTAVIGASQRTRANSVEMLDEIEEWILIMRHYCFVVAGIATESKGDLARYLCAAGNSSPIGFMPAKSVTKKACHTA